MEDAQVAKLILSTLLGEENTELRFSPQERIEKERLLQLLKQAGIDSG